MSHKSLKDTIRAISLNVKHMGRDPSYLRHVKRLGEAQQDWWRHENVVGVCIARSRRNGRLGPLCLQVLVRRKYAKGKLAARHIVPDELRCAAFKRPIRTDVRAVGGMRLDTLVTSQRPAQPGYDIGNRRSSSSGTLSCIVIDQQGTRLGLSCAHVISPGGASDLTSPTRKIVICPSLTRATDQGQLAEAPIGTLVNVLAPSFDPADADTNIDAAVFAPNDTSALSAQIADVGSAPTGINGSVAHGDKVHKVGATSGLTEGTVQGIELLTKVPYGDDVATFTDHIIVSNFASPGDSGALVLDEQNRAVGIHIGSADGMSVCTPIRRVLIALQCRLELG